MEKENGEAGDGSKGNDASSLLDAASLFGAYWGRDPSALLSSYGAGAASFGLLGAAAAAAAAQGGGGGSGGAGSSGGGGGGGGGGGSGGRYPPSSTLSVAASQAASLGLHPAASAAWWSMASQLAAQDYLARLQASGLGGFPPGSDPYGLAAAAGLAQAQSRGSSSAGTSGTGQSTRGRPPGASRGPHNRTSHSTAVKDKDKNSLRSSYGLPKTSSPSMSSMQGLSALGLNSLAGSRTPTLPSHSPQPPHSSSSSSKHSRKSSAAAKASALSGAYLGGVTSKSGSSSGVGGGSGGSNTASSPSPSSSSTKDKDLSSMMRSDLLMAQAAMAQNAYQAAVAQQQGKGGKNSSSLFGNPFGLGSLSSEKDRHSGLDSLANLPHTILSAALEGSDGASILGGVRLPPDTEIIKYTSSIVGPKVPGTTNRGRKKTISLDPPQVSVHPALSSTGLLVERGGPAKRPKLESEYSNPHAAHQNSSVSSLSGGSGSDRVEVIKLPSSASDSRSSTAPFSMSSYTGLSKELLQSIANQSGLNLAALEKQFAQQFGTSPSYSKSSSYSTNQDMGLNLSAKSSHSSSQPQREESPASTANDDDAPLNLSLKPSSSSTKSTNDDWKSNSSASSRLPDEATSSLNSLSNITASLGGRSQPPSLDRVSRRKPGAKPRRVIQESSPSPSHPPGQESPTPSGSEDSDMGPWHPTKEGRPRNLGRGVSKPKKNTVASLLAQSRALGIRPALAQQYLQEAADLLNPELQEKLKAAMSDMSAGLIPPPELSGTDSDGGPPGSDSCADDSDASDAMAAEPMLRLPLAMGWRRETLMKGLSRNGSIKGDVTYYPPDPRSNIKLKNIVDLMNFLEKNPCPPLQKENFSFSSKPLIGRFLQANGQEGMSETEVAKRLEEARRALSSASTASLAVEQRIELARQQQAAREARKDAAKGREQARLAREQERSEKAEQAKREKEARNQQLLEAQIKQANESLKILNANEQSTIGFWKSIQAIASSSSVGGKQISVSMPSMSLTLTPVPSLTISPVTPAPSTTHSQWKEEYNALDRIKSFAETAALTFSPSKTKQEIKKDFKLIPVKQEVRPRNNSVTLTKVKGERGEDDQNKMMLNKVLQAYSRMNEFLSGKCAWAKNTPSQKKIKSNKLDDFKDIENRYLRAKNDYMYEYLTLLPNEETEIKSVFETRKVVEVIDLVDNEEEEMAAAVVQRKADDDHALTAKRKRQEDIERQKQEEITRKQQERELKRQQTVMLKEQMYMAEVGKQRELIYTVELERERRRQHMSLVKQLENRRRYEEREKRKNRMMLDKLAIKEKKLEQRQKELELLKELRKPQEDSTLSDQKPLPTYNRIPGLKLPGQAMADILMVFEFINNFGQTLGFDMDTLPSLNTLQMSLLPDCCTEAEDELLSILIHLLVCAIEDPGIPHPGRHTTILGHTLKVNEVTPANVSEVLRIYLYANATGEIKSLTGINPERDRERRVADHHQSDADVQQQILHGRNSTYYAHLHNNPTWRLAEKLRHHPYLALNPTSKARILAMLCDELLQSKPVLRQIDQSLDHVNQLKKDRYLMEIKLRKLKMLHSRKVRTEAAEKQQALALERMQRMVEENEVAANSTPNSTERQDAAVDQHNAEEEKVDTVASDVGANEEKKPEEVSVNHDETSDMEVVVMGAPPLKEDQPTLQPHQVLGKTGANGTKEDKDSVMGDAEIILSDVESEGTQPEEDEDKNLSAEELSRKLEKLIRQSDAQLQNLLSGAHSIRATCYGQDRYWRRYWSLSKCGGVFVEAMESTQPEIMAYHEKMEECAKKREEGEAASRLANKKTRNKKGPKPKAGAEAEAIEASAKSTEQLLQNELELRNIKSELNLSDHTRIIKYEPNMGHKVQGSPIKMEEKHIQQQKVAEDHLLDIEDSIPTAFLVQKPPSNEPRKSVYPVQPGADGDKVETPVKIENTADVKTESSIKNEQENSQNSVDSCGKVDKKEGAYLNNLEELKKLAESVVPPKENSQPEVKQENSNGNESIKEEKVEVKEEHSDVETANTYLNNKMNDGKWFSILRKENPLAETTPVVVQQANGIDEKDPNIKNIPTETQPPNTNCNSVPINTINIKPIFADNTQTCSEICVIQGNRWDVCNNLHLLTNPTILFTGNGLQNQQNCNMNSFHDPDCTMTMSGLDEEMIDLSLNPKQETLNETNETTQENGCKDVTVNHVDEPMDQSNLMSDTSDGNMSCDKSLNKNKSKTNVSLNNVSNLSVTGSTNNTVGGVNISALTAYVTCDSPAPLQMTQEESEQLEYCKVNGLPKKLEGNFVPKDLRYGWWRITDTDQLKEVLGKLHPRGVREKDLYSAFMAGLLQTNNKIHIEKGDLLATELSISHLDRVIALNGGFPSPDSASSFSVKTARRIDQSLLEQIEALEERVAAASMQVKGWKPPPHTTPASTPPHCEEQTTVAASRSRLLGLEAAIERRYLRPPLGAAPPCPPTNPNSTTSSVNSTPSHDQDNNKDEEAQAQREVTPEPKGPTNVPRGLAVWREGTSRCQTSAQLAMVLHTLESAIAWDKSIMKANCQFCQSGDSEDKLLLCDGCDKGYHTYCFKPKMEKIPDGDWYCYECLNKATGERVCIVCGGKSGAPPPGSTRGGRLVHCALCPRAYHQDCHYPPLNKVPRGKWYCVKCIVRAPPKKPRNTKKAKNNSTGDSFSDSMQPPSPAVSQASNTTNDDCPMTSVLTNQSSLSSVQSTPEKHFPQNTSATETNKQHFAVINNLNSINDNQITKNLNDGLNDTEEYGENDKYFETEDAVKNNEPNNVYEDFKDLEEFGDLENNLVIDKRQSGNKVTTTIGDDVVMDGDGSCGTVENDSNSGNNSEEYQGKGESASDRERELRHCKKDRNPQKRLIKELAMCKALLEEMELHDDSWPFLLPVNTKQFPTYKKIIRTPMDLSTIKRKLQEMSYKSKEEFACDVRQIFHNCEVFNEDESPVGRAGHGMRKFFEERWANVV